MNQFQWREAFSIGDAAVDNQHKKIFTLLAELHRDILGNDSEAAFKLTLKELLEYTKTHFADEEKLMRSVGYPDYDAHKALHDAMIDKVWGMYVRCNDGNPDLALEVLVLLNGWLVNHILEKDKEMTSYVRQHEA